MGKGKRVPVFYSPDFVSARFAFETTRKAKWIADSISKSPIPKIQLQQPRPLEFSQLESVHESKYIHAVQTGEPKQLAESQGFDWDPGLWRMVMASNGGVVEAALAAISNGVAGSLSSGLHHARSNRGFGFCTFNGLVIAATEALSRGISPVLILDFDAHCGGGTASLIASIEEIWQIDVSVNSYDSYITLERSSLDIVDRAARYLSVITSKL